MYPVIKPVMATGTKDIFVYLGFCPDLVEIVDYTAKVTAKWHRVLGNDAALISTPDGTDGSEDVTAAADDKGIKLCRFNKPGVDLDSDPKEVTDPNEADGIIITSDLGSGDTSMSDGDILWVYAWAQQTPFVRAKHDGGSKPYLKDSDIDFKEAGVSEGQLWVAINITQKKYAYVGEIQKPFGESKHNKVTLTDSGGNAITSNMADDDVIWLMPKDEAQYPLSDVGAFS